MDVHPTSLITISSHITIIIINRHVFDKGIPIARSYLSTCLPTYPRHNTSYTDRKLQDIIKISNYTTTSKPKTKNIRHTGYLRGRLIYTFTVHNTPVWQRLGTIQLYDIVYYLYIISHYIRYWIFTRIGLDRRNKIHYLSNSKIPENLKTLYILLGILFKNYRNQEINMEVCTLCSELA